MEQSSNLNSIWIHSIFKSVTMIGSTVSVALPKLFNILKLAGQHNVQTIGLHSELIENDHDHFQGLSKVRIKLFNKLSSNLKNTN